MGGVGNLLGNLLGSLLGTPVNTQPIVSKSENLPNGFSVSFLLSDMKDPITTPVSAYMTMNGQNYPIDFEILKSLMSQNLPLQSFLSKVPDLPSQFQNTIPQIDTNDAQQDYPSITSELEKQKNPDGTIYSKDLFSKLRGQIPNMPLNEVFSDPSQNYQVDPNTWKSNSQKLDSQMPAGELFKQIPGTDGGNFYDFIQKKLPAGGGSQSSGRKPSLLGGILGGGNPKASLSVSGGAGGSKKPKGLLGVLGR